jgi:hypothetical protein
MGRPVRQHTHFEADYLALLDGLVEQENGASIEALASGVEEIARMLSKLPGVGSRIAQDGPVLMRKIIFPKGPWVAWYVYDAEDPSGAVWLLRLFHARQKRPHPARWLKRQFLGR